MRVGLGVVYGIVLGLGLLAQSGFTPGAHIGGPAAVQAPPAEGERISYQDSRRPTLLLPDGETRVVRSLLSNSRQLEFGDYLWNDAGIAAGPVWVRVDLTRQILSVFRSGHEIGTAVILFGAKSHPTPSGVYPVLAKAQVHRSSLYDADMPFMMRLTNDGVAIHASSVREGSATHGCIGVPMAFARLLYQQLQIGDQVAIIAA